MLIQHISRNLNSRILFKLRSNRKLELKYVTGLKVYNSISKIEKIEEL